MSDRAIAKSYWRSIKRGTKTFAQVPEELAAMVRELAQRDLQDGVITQEDYLRWIGLELEE